jgi:hypothetical protein
VGRLVGVGVVGAIVTGEALGIKVTGAFELGDEVLGLVVVGDNVLGEAVGEYVTPARVGARVTGAPVGTLEEGALVGVVVDGDNVLGFDEDGDKVGAFVSPSLKKLCVIPKY